MQTTLLLLLLMIGVILLLYVYGNLSWKLNSLYYYREVVGCWQKNEGLNGRKRILLCGLAKGSVSFLKVNERIVIMSSIVLRLGWYCSV